jgi:hypothetical protein
MFSRSIIVDSSIIYETSSDATTWSSTFNHHSDNFRGVIYNHNSFIKQATGASIIKKFTAVINSMIKQSKSVCHF